MGLWVLFSLTAYKHVKIGMYNAPYVQTTLKECRQRGYQTTATFPGQSVVAQVETLAGRGPCIPRCCTRPRSHSSRTDVAQVVEDAQLVANEALHEHKHADLDRHQQQHDDHGVGAVALDDALGLRGDVAQHGIAWHGGLGLAVECNEVQI